MLERQLASPQLVNFVWDSPEGRGSIISTGYWPGEYPVDLLVQRRAGIGKMLEMQWGGAGVEVCLSSPNSSASPQHHPCTQSLLSSSYGHSRVNGPCPFMGSEPLLHMERQYTRCWAGVTCMVSHYHGVHPNLEGI